MENLLAEFKKIKKTLFKTAQACIAAGYGQPFFIISEQPQSALGELLIAPKELQNQYHCYINDLSFWKEKGWIDFNQAQKKYPNPKKNCCICWITDQNSSFIHIPYEILPEKKN